MGSVGEQKPVYVGLHHDRGVERYLGVRPFDVEVSHESRAGGSFYVGREAWMSFLNDVVNGGPYENGVLEVVHRGGRIREMFGGEKIPTPWCLRTVKYNESIYLSDPEWQEFQRLARAGEYDVPPTPAVRPAIGRIGRAVIAAALVAAIAALIAGTATTVIAGGASGVVLGISAAAALSSAVLYYVAGRSLSTPQERTEEAFAARDRVERLLFRLPELVVAVGVAVPALAGLVTAVAAGNWRWAATGFVIGAALPAFGVLLALLVATSSDGSLSTGHLLVGGTVLSAGLPGLAVYALWTGHLRVLLIGGGIILAFAVLSAFFATSSYLDGD